MNRILVVDDDPTDLRRTANLVAEAGYLPVVAESGAAALALLRDDPGIGAVILDLVMPDLDGFAVLEIMRREQLTPPVIVQLTSTAAETVATAMRHGAADFFVKPVTPERLQVALRNALKREALATALRTEHHRRAGTLRLGDQIAESPGMDRVVALCGKAARNRLPVLVEGEPGAGKEFVARLIHGIGDRSGKPLLALNCATIPEHLLEPELFGHRSGAPGGARPELPGKFVEARGGTLLLEEVGELSPRLQEKLLRALETDEVVPAGGTRPERVNVRVIATSSRRLLNLARSGAIREDLYYRLNVLPIYLPPLRERLEDVAPLVAGFIARFGAELRKPVDGIAAEALALLAAYNWPGNVGQLENAVHRAVVLAESPVLQPADFPQVGAAVGGRAAALQHAQSLERPSEPVHIDLANSRRRPSEPLRPSPDRFLGADGEVAPLAAVERDLIAFALDRYRGRMSRIARALGMGRSTLYRKLRDYGLDGSLDSDAA
jgi:DNA-binding NtrC family response regulator